MPTELVLFKEKQRLPALALVVIIVLGIGLPVYIAIQQLWVGKPFGHHSASSPVVAVLVPLIVLVALALTGLSLDTRLYRDRLRVRCFPVADETFPLTRIVRWEIRDYSVTIFKEFIGWGARLGTDSVAYTMMKGRRGLQLVLEDGSRVFIGSQRPEDLASALTTAARDTSRIRP